MKKLFFLVTLMTSGLILFAQNLKWAKSLGGTTSDHGRSVAVDANGNVYTIGQFEGTADFDPGSGTYNLTSNGKLDIFISKLDADGKFLWAKKFGGTQHDRGNAIAVDDDGYVYAAGGFWFTTDFDPGSGTYNVSSKGWFDVFVLKLDGGGNFVWVSTFGGTGSEEANDIAIGSSGSIYTTGSFIGEPDFDPGSGTYKLTSNENYADIFISKLNSKGNFVWAKGIGGTRDEAGYSIGLSQNEDVYTTGYFHNEADFDPGTGVFKMTSNNLSDDIFISKLDSAGNFSWAKKLSGWGNEYAYSLAVDKIGNIYTTGKFNSDVDFDPGSGSYSLTSAGNNDIFISKLDSSGSFVWAKRMGSYNSDDGGHSIDVDDFGNVYTSGYYQLPLDADPGNGTYNLTQNGNEDIFISKLNTSGDFILAYGFGQMYDDIPYGLFVDKAGAIYMTGEFEQTIDFDPGSGTYNVTSAGSRDAFVFQFCALPAAASTISGSLTVCAQESKTYSTTEVNGANAYIWSVPPGAKINYGQNTLSLNVAFGTSSGNIIVTPKNSCGNGTSKSLGINVKPLPLFTQPKDQIVTKGLKAMFSISSSSPSATFQWQVDTGGGFSNLLNSSKYSGVKNDTLTIISVSLIQNGFKFRCIVEDASCPDTTTIATLTVKTGNIHEVSTDDIIQIYPNPVRGQISISGHEKIEKIEIFDALGLIVHYSKPREKELRIDMERIGIYIIKLTLENRTLTRKIVVQ